MSGLGCSGGLVWCSEGGSTNRCSVGEETGEGVGRVERDIGGGRDRLGTSGEGRMKRFMAGLQSRAALSHKADVMEAQGTIFYHSRATSQLQDLVGPLKPGKLSWIQEKLLQVEEKLSWNQEKLFCIQEKLLWAVFRSFAWAQNSFFLDPEVLKQNSVNNDVNHK
eukprot:TRINITY_DN13601_c0_g1_i1.p1 TRINITY_DN13601_c0_g1~~TRINITY_DN13601_c0_g1_i1.p1  ORF type:complete len:165 (-),score=10.05 TRINITY_DN13601_c0_g1_i1:77-571(-)